MKKSYLFFALLLGCLAVLVITGWYPVARVNGRIITYARWTRLESAATRMASIDAQSTGGAGTAVAEAQRNTLTFLIENILIASEGKTIVPDLAAKSRARVRDATREASTLGQSAEMTFGLNRRDFEKFILIPQAMREILEEELTAQKKDFDAWFTDVKQNASVDVFFVPFAWDGTEIQ
ncbi:MAG: hypothetical protein AAB539_00535 [Patescibacteria group bacterium]